MGSVYRAVDENLGVEVAVKDNLFTTEEYARQFRREAVILANLRHSNLPRVTDHFVIEGQGQYLVMDYIEGEDLRQRMERVGVVPEEEVITIGAAVCDALAYLGSRQPPIIHRDIKPGNVKITPQGHIFLVDFGLAKTMRGSQATTTGARAMTPGYSPPEQYGTARTDQRSDIFSLGATLYAALTGATPEDALARAMDQAELTPIRKHNPRISRRLTTAIEKALEVRPDDRYQTAEEFKQALLGASASSRRRESDFFVAPPPAEGRPTLEEDEPIIAQVAEQKVARAEARSPQLLPISTPLEKLIKQQPVKPRKQKKRGGCLLILLLLFLVLIAGVAAVYALDPGLPARALMQFAPQYAPYLPVIFAPAAATDTPVAMLRVTSSPMPEPVTSQPEQITPTQETALTELPTPTFTVQPTEILIPTETLTALPTAFGGTGQIAFAADSSGIPQIYVIRVDGSGQRQITGLPEGACQPDWSPDGKRLVFISPCDSNKDYYPESSMYIINEDGSGLLPLSTLSGGDYDPKWSPDGSRIVFTSLRNSGRPQIYVLKLEDNSATPLSEQYAFDFQPVWSPDGKKILFVSTRRGGQQVWVMNADGGEATQFTRNQNLMHFRPSWSLDMKTIIITQMVEAGGIPKVVLAPYTFDDYIEYRIGRERLPMKEAVYSPDGYWIAFEGWEAGGNHSIYIIAATGAGLSQVTDDPRTEFDPVWKPVP
ncbi:MAG: PD40 domain-containing protein [Anaerolineales bacterium]|nr:PD40 domain-containing protein [Anaerolineales bacterium]